MKRIIPVILLLMTAVFLFGCTRVIETPADELTTASWVCVNPDGSTAGLVFSDPGTAVFKIQSADGETAVISGKYSIDGSAFYISSDNLLRVYEFPYSVYKDRALITYGGSTLTFLRNDNEA